MCRGNGDLFARVLIEMSIVFVILFFRENSKILFLVLICLLIREYSIIFMG